MKILMVLTSHDELGDTGKKTGFWLEEFAAPYYVLKDAGHDITLASPAGGQPPLDPKSDEPDAQTDATRRFKDDEEAQAHLASTLKLAEVDVSDFDGVFYPGGHGPLWDLAESADSKATIEGALSAGKPIVKGRKVTGFTNEEEEAVGLTDVVPFLLEDVLKQQGGDFSEGGVFEPHVVRDGLLITGQNPPSSEPTAKKLLEVLAAAG